MTYHETELFTFPIHGTTPLEQLPDRFRMRDALVARLDGYRPLRIDVDVPLTDGAPVPVVAFIHGGAWQWGDNKLQDGPVPSPMIRESLIAHGIAFAAVDYRLAAEATWPAPLHDVKSAIRWLRHYAPELGLDPSRIAVWGESAGGHLAALLATATDPAWSGAVGVVDVPDRVAACVNWYGPTDLELLATDEPGDPVRALLGNDLGAAAEASPLTHVTEHAAPMLIVHGTGDTIVPVAQGILLANRYRESSRPIELTIVEGAGHAFAGIDPEQQILPSVEYLLRQFAR